MIDNDSGDGQPMEWSDHSAIINTVQALLDEIVDDALTDGGDEAARRAVVALDACRRLADAALVVVSR